MELDEPLQASLTLDHAVGKRRHPVNPTTWQPQCGGLRGPTCGYVCRRAPFPLFRFLSAFLFLPTTICRIDADHYEITYAIGGSKVRLSYMGFDEVPQRKVGNKTQEWFPFWSTASHLQRCMICKCMASLVLLHKFTVIQRVSSNIVFHIHKMKELIFKIQMLLFMLGLLFFFIWEWNQRDDVVVQQKIVHIRAICVYTHIFSVTWAEWWMTPRSRAVMGTDSQH